MIVELILDVVKAVLLFLIGLFPELPDMSELLGFFEPVFELYLNVDAFISVKVLGSCVLFLIIFCNIEFIWGIVMWVLRKIPGEK